MRSSRGAPLGRGSASNGFSSALQVSPSPLDSLWLQWTQYVRVHAHPGRAAEERGWSLGEKRLIEKLVLSRPHTWTSDAGLAWLAWAKLLFSSFFLVGAVGTASAINKR